MRKGHIGKFVWECEEEILKSNLRRKLPHSHEFINNQIRVIIGCSFYWLLLIVHKILEKTKTFVRISRQ